MTDTQDVRLYISVPSNRDWKGRFGSSFVDLITHLTTSGIQTPGYNLSVFKYQLYRQASNISKARQHFVDSMITEGFTHWLSLDDDMTFPMDLVDRLISTGKDVISCNARRKTEEVIGSCQGLDGQPIDSTDRSGIQELRTMGGAIFLAKIDTFRSIPKPHFQVLWSPEHDDYVSEDVHFATLLRVNGVRLWCDHNTSQHIGHIGDYEYRFPAVQQAEIRRVA